MDLLELRRLRKRVKVHYDKSEKSISHEISPGVNRSFCSHRTMSVQSCSNRNVGDVKVGPQGLPFVLRTSSRVRIRVMAPGIIAPECKCHILLILLSLVVKLTFGAWTD